MPCLLCELPELLEQTSPPDPDLVDLIEQAFLEGQIDGVKADLAERAGLIRIAFKRSSPLRGALCASKRFAFSGSLAARAPR